MTSTVAAWTLLEATPTAAPWTGVDVIWIVVAGFLLAFVLAFAVGANDVANSFGTAVGAKVLTEKQACVLATIFETTGAVLLGAKVGETIRKGIIDVEVYDVMDNGVTLLMLGEVAAMFGSAVWQLIATLFKLPVSGTHSIVGACIGFSLVAAGSAGVHWTKLAMIVCSWFVSPVLSGIMAVLLFFFVNKFILNKANPLRNGLRLLPLFYSVTIGINAFSIIYSGAPMLGLDKLPVWGSLLLSVGFMLVTALLVYFIAVPRTRRKARALARAEASEACESGKTGEGSEYKMVTTADDSGYQTPSDKQHPGLNTSAITTSLVESLADHNVDNFRPLSTSTTSSRSGDSCVSLAPPAKEDDALNENPGEEWKKESSDKEVLATIGVDFKNTQISSSSEKSLSGESEKKVSDAEEKTEEEEEEEEEDPLVVRELFSSLQILTACFASFAHGGNDVSNAIGPLIALWMVFQSGEVVQKSFTPWYLLLYGSAGICIGLWLMGKRVMDTIGKNLTKVTPSRGFCIELMTAITVLLASNVGIPVSTTHCKVGAVVSIGWVRSRSAVDWSLVRNIAIAWFVTVPVSALFSAGAMWLLMQFAL